MRRNFIRGASIGVRRFIRQKAPTSGTQNSIPRGTVSGATQINLSHFPKMPSLKGMDPNRRGTRPDASVGVFKTVPRGAFRVVAVRKVRQADDLPAAVA